MMRRVLLGVFVAISFAMLGFGLAMVLAFEIVYPGPPELGRGLARLSFGLGGGMLGLAAGVVLAFRLQHRRLLLTALAGLLLGCASLAFLAWRVAQQRAVEPEQNAAAPGSVSAPPAGRLPTALLLDQIHAPVPGAALFGPVRRHGG